MVSKSQYDQFRTWADVSREAVRAAQAGIESARAALESDLAAVDRAKLDLNYARFTRRSPAARAICSCMPAIS